MKFSIGESKSKGFKIFSWLVEKIEGVNHSHIFISWKDSMGLRWVAEARGGGIRIVSNVEFKQSNTVVNIYQYPCNEDQFERAITYIWEESHKDYGYLQIVGLLWMRLGNFALRKFNVKSKFTNPFRDGDFSQICCEFGINTVSESLGVEPPEFVENYGLIETREFNFEHGLMAAKELINRINNG